MGIKTIKDLKVYEAAYKLAMRGLLRNTIFRHPDPDLEHIRFAQCKLREREGEGSQEILRRPPLNQWRTPQNDGRWKLDKQYDEVNAMLYGLMKNWQDFSEEKK